MHIHAANGGFWSLRWASVVLAAMVAPAARADSATPGSTNEAEVATRPKGRVVRKSDDSVRTRKRPLRVDPLLTAIAGLPEAPVAPPAPLVTFVLQPISIPAPFP